MKSYDRMLKEETFYVHPFEMCVVRTVPDEIYGRTTYVKFSGKAEHEPPRGSDIVAKSVWMNSEPEWITKEEYNNF